MAAIIFPPICSAALARGPSPSYHPSVVSLPVVVGPVRARRILLRSMNMTYPTMQRETRIRMTMINMTRFSCMLVNGGVVAQKDVPAKGVFADVGLISCIMLG